MRAKHCGFYCERAAGFCSDVCNDDEGYFDALVRAWKTVRPSDTAGVVGVACPRIAAAEEHYVFGYVRNLSDLFLVEHLK
jgi:hypothetical protein